MAEIFGFGTNRAIKRVRGVASKKGLKSFKFAYGTVWAKNLTSAKRELKKELLKKKKVNKAFLLLWVCECTF
jgi:hypothetical protein